MEEFPTTSGEEKMDLMPVHRGNMLELHFPDGRYFGVVRDGKGGVKVSSWPKGNFSRPYMVRVYTMARKELYETQEV